MSRVYGIDLGTTNSLISCYETGFISDLVPSCVDMKTGKAGKDYFEDMNAERSFKIDISMGTEGNLSRVASKCVLQALKDEVKDDVVKDVVISVPAYFTDNQRTATMEAAKNAGLNVLNLVNEPTAAAMYIARQAKGLFVVFDLGGGTFDVSIIDSRYGAYDVQATSGTILGGDDFDNNLARYFMKNGKIPIHTMNKQRIKELTHFASKIKIEMQNKRSPFPVDLSKFGGISVMFTPEDYTALMKTTFSETINLTKKLINKWIDPTDLYDILLVGGSTHCPFLRDWLFEETGIVPAPLKYDPDRVVALGAGYYADIAKRGELGTKISDVTTALSIGLEDGTCSTVVKANSKIPLTEERVYANGVASNKLSLKLYQGDKLWRKDNEFIGELIYEYDEVKEANMGQVFVNISIDVNGVITFSARELLKEPKTIVLDRNKEVNNAG